MATKKTVKQTMTTVLGTAWNVSVTTCTGEPVTLDIYRIHNHKVLYNGAYNGRKFATAEEAWDFAFSLGFIRPYYRRNTDFIRLRLSPRSRKFVAEHFAERGMACVRQVCNSDNRGYAYCEALPLNYRSA